jgi:hypothetical protein
MSRNPHRRVKPYSNPTMFASFTTADDEQTSVNLDGRKLVLPISTESSLSWKEPLKSLLIALGQEATKEVTFIVADSLQRHTLYMENLGYILKLETSEFTNADIDTYVRDRMGLRDLHKDLLKTSDPTQRKTRFQSGIADALAQQATQKGAGWEQKTQQIITFLAETVSNAHEIPPPITYPQVFSDSDGFRCLHWNALLKRHDYVRLRAHTDDQCKKNDDFRAIIEKASTTFINKKLQLKEQGREYPSETAPNYAEFMGKLKQSSVEYLLEEAAITIGLMQSGKYQMLAYPFGEQDTNKPLFDLLHSLAQIANSHSVQPIAIQYTKPRPLKLTSETLASLDRQMATIIGPWHEKSAISHASDSEIDSLHHAMEQDEQNRGTPSCNVSCWSEEIKAAPYAIVAARGVRVPPTEKEPAKPVVQQMSIDSGNGSSERDTTSPEGCRGKLVGLNQPTTNGTGLFSVKKSYASAVSETPTQKPAVSRQASQHQQFTVSFSAGRVLKKHK